MADLLYDDGASRVRPARSRGSTAGSRASASGPSDSGLSTQQASMLRWQRQLGNRAVTAAVQRNPTPPEPVEEEKESGRTQVERGTGGVAPLLGGGRSGAGGPSTFDSNDSSPDFGGGSTSAALRVGTLATDIHKVWGASKQVHQARKDKKAAGGEGERHLAERDLKTGGGDVAEKAASIPGNLVKGGTKIASLAGAPSTAATATGGGLALPAQLFSLIRSVRKLAKQGARYDRLKKLQLTTFQDPGEMVRTARQGMAEVDGALALLTLEVQRLQNEWDGTQDPEWSAALAEAQDAHTQLEGQLRIRTAQLAEAERDKAQSDALTQTIAARFPGATKAPTLAEIVEYSKAKQQRGLIKKAISSTGGTIAVAGTAVALAVAIGVGSGLVLTPVGWGLAALAAALGVGVAGYKAIQRFRKFAARRRQDANGPGGHEQRSRGQRVKDFGKNLLDTFNPRKAAPSERTGYAEALLDYFTAGTADQKTEARKIIIALLGIEKSKRRDKRLADMTETGRRDKYVKLLAAKMAS